MTFLQVVFLLRSVLSLNLHNYSPNVSSLIFLRVPLGKKACTLTFSVGARIQALNELISLFLFPKATEGLRTVEAAAAKEAVLMNDLLSIMISFITYIKI